MNNTRNNPGVLDGQVMPPGPPPKTFTHVSNTGVTSTTEMREGLRHALLYTPVLGDPAEPNEYIDIRVRQVIRHKPQAGKDYWDLGPAYTVTVTPTPLIGLIANGDISLVKNIGTAGSRTLLLNRASSLENHTLTYERTGWTGTEIRTGDAMDILKPSLDRPRQPKTLGAVWQFLIDMQWVWSQSHASTPQDFFNKKRLVETGGFEVPEATYFRNTLHGSKADGSLIKVVPQKYFVKIREGQLVEVNGQEVEPTHLTPTPTSPAGQSIPTGVEVLHEQMDNLYDEVGEVKSMLQEVLNRLDS